MLIQGKIVYHTFEGGFWGIEADDGQCYLPVKGLPGAYQVKNLRVKADLTPSSAVSLQMWGQPVQIRSIHKQ